MTRYGLDYGGYLSPTQITSAATPTPPTFVMRYLREIGAGEIATLHAAGIDVGMIFEYPADVGPGGIPSPLGGYNQGIADGKLALSQLANLSAPDIAVYYTVDFGPKRAQLKVIAQYFKGIASVFPFARIGGYADYSTVGYLFNNSLIAFGWQTVDRSGTNFNSRCVLYQYKLYQQIGPVSTDFNEAFADTFGLWTSA